MWYGLCDICVEDYIRADGKLNIYMSLGLQSLKKKKKRKSHVVSCFIFPFYILVQNSSVSRRRKPTALYRKCG